MDSFDIMKYVDMALRRKYWVIIPFLIACLGGLAYALKAPKIYEAETLILVQPQKVPTDFVRSIVSAGIEERLRTITQQVTSRTNLEEIIKEYKLFPGSGMLIDQKVELLRKQVRINVVRGGQGSGNAFEIAFKGKDPRTVMQVTNALASNFISENLKIRESQALGTSAFLSDELESIRQRLAQREAQVQDFRRKNMGSLPDQLQTNLSVLSRLQMQQEQLENRLKDSQNRKLIIQKQISDAEMMQKQMGESVTGNELIEIEEPATQEVGEGEDLSGIKKQLALLKGRYTEKHPDVVRLKKLVEKMAEEAASNPDITPEEIETGIKAAESGTGPSAPELGIPTMDDFLRPQLDQINIEINETKSEIIKVQSKIETYQQRVEDTPKREQDMLSMTRDYENMKTLYDSMLARKLEAEIAVSMEKKQKGEQFRVIDPAKIPSQPVEPDMKKILMMAVVLGLALGCGMAYLIEFLDSTYKSPEELEKELKLPVLVGIPILYTARDLKIRRIKTVAVPVFLLLAFILSATGIVIAIKGVEPSLEYLRNMIAKI